MRQIIHYLIFFIATNLFFMPQFSIAEEGESGAIAVVEELHTALLNTMQNAENLGYQGRYEALAPVIQPRFDTPLIVKVILGRYWKGLEEQQQTRFADLFSRLSISTYAYRFDGYSGETFKTLGVEKLKKGRLLVKTEISSPDSKPVRLDYLMNSSEGQWYIISVIADGVNDLSLKRAEYKTVIKEKGFDSLVDDIENKIKNHANS